MKRDQTDRHKLYPRTPAYRSWEGAIQRCTNPKNKAYPDYGGSGIKVCARWMKFENFLSDMGARPEGKTIDRIDNEKGYEPGNCRWATPREQTINRRGTSKLLTLGDETMIQSDWAARIGISVPALINRLRKHSVEVALTTPVPARYRR
jgi:hypothetical protein